MAMAWRTPILFLAFLAIAVAPAHGDSAKANPVRKVVSMLQSMMKKVTKEGEREDELYSKYLCYCKTSMKDLEDSVEHAETRVPQLESELKASEEGLKTDQAEREATKKAIAQATQMREREYAAFVKTKDDGVANIRAVQQSIATVEKGAGGALLQAGGTSRLQRILEQSSAILDEDRQTVLAALSGSASYAPATGQITGILKQMGDSMASSLAKAVAAEEKALHIFREMVRAKTAEVDALTEAIEAKTTKIGELGVFIAETKDELKDVSDTLVEDKAFLAELSKGCDTKAAEWMVRKKTRTQELAALAETVKILNDDDALELFKKTLPAPSSAAAASFVQLRSSSDTRSRRAAAHLRKVRRGASARSRAQLDVVLLAISGRKSVDFKKVISMLDGMLATLAAEGKEDEKKNKYCESELDQAEDKSKELDFQVQTETNNIDKTRTAVENTAEEIAALADAVKSLDQEVADATQQRQKENSEYKELKASNSAAKELLEIAKNRLNKFYSPSLYKPPAKTELSQQDRIYVNMGNPDGAVTTPAPGGIADTGVTAFTQLDSSEDAEQAPGTPTGDYSRKNEESAGVIQMINLLITDVETDMAEAETNDKEAQSEYEELMQRAQKVRTEHSKTMADKEQVKAETETDLESHKKEQLSAYKELEATHNYIKSLHADCDWLLQSFSVRKEARAGEAQALKDAKAVLSGADYSFLQIGERQIRHRLRGA